MADQVREYNMNTLTLENAFHVIDLKKEETKEDNFEDDKVQISETVITTSNPEFQDHLLPAKMKLCGISANLDNVKEEFSTSEVKYDITYDNIKIEEGSSPDNIKIELNNGLLYCDDCQVYCEDYCAKCGMLVHILNKAVPINADNISREELPNYDILEIQDYFGELHVLALKMIPAGVRFGPFTGLNRTERSWKIKGGKFVVNSDESKYLNWMQYINAARNISEQNLLAFQHKRELYYKSTRQIQEGDELLVYFGEEYEDRLNRNAEMDFIPTAGHIFKDAFACTFCCLGFSSKWYLAKHKTICLRNSAERFSIEEIMQCPSCKVHLDQKEYTIHHMTCSERKNRKCFQLTEGNETTQVAERKTRPNKMHKCQQCKYRTKYKGDLKNHTNLHYEVKLYKCGFCYRRFKTKQVLILHLENICARRKEDSEPPTEVYIKAHIKAEPSCSQDEIQQFKCSLCAFGTKYKTSLKRHMAEKHLKEFTYKWYSMCDYKTNCKRNLKTHVETKHLKEFKYKCDRCDYKTNRKAYLKTHIETKHLNVFKYKCDICSYKTNSQSYLKIHIETKHLKVFKYRCDKCDYKAKHKVSLKAHIETKHLKEFKYKCDICDYKTNRKAYLKSHIETKHLKVFKYKCDICNYKTNSQSYLKIHIEAKHLKEFKYKCDLCDYKANQKVHLKTHIETKHLKEFKYKCDRCDYKTNCKPNLKTHIETRHLKEFKYKCDTCDYKANRKYQLKIHIETRHLKNFKYRCGSCDYKTHCKSNLKTHIEARHLDDFKYKCDTCDYKAKWKSNLKTHIEAMHLNEFKYKCDTCDYKTNCKSNLKSHVEARHVKEFEYKCDTCDYKANWKSNLKEHIKTRHLKDFKYKCDICDYKAIWKSRLTAHIEERHLKEFKHMCDICDYKTNRKNRLKSHIDTKHLKQFK